MNVKKRLPPISPFDVSIVNLLAREATQIRAQHPAGHPFRNSKDQLRQELLHLTENLHYTPAQIAEETTLSYRSIKRYLAP